MLKKFYADTAIIRSKYPICCIRRDNAGENMSNALKTGLLIRVSALNPQLHMSHGKMVEQKFRFACYAISLT